MLKHLQQLTLQLKATPRRWRRLIIFAVILLLLIVPLALYRDYNILNNLKSVIMADAKKAINSLTQAKSSLTAQNFSAADQDFAQANAQFFAANASLAKNGGALLAIAKVLPIQQGKLAASAQHLLAAAGLASQLGQETTKIMAAVYHNPDKNISQILSLTNTSLEQIIPLADKLTKEMAVIDPTILPQEYQNTFSTVRAQTANLGSTLREIADLTKKLNLFLGADQTKRYLLIFQNTAEARATGGFMGSYAVVDMDRGEIKNLMVPTTGSYDTKTKQTKLVRAPLPLLLANTRWQFWDANWWPDWPRSAKKISSFYESGGGSTVDGIISFTPEVIEQLLTVTGPLDLSPDFPGLTVSSDNFWLATQQLTEKKHDDASEPKKIIGVLMAKVMAVLPQKISSQENLLKLLGVVEKSLAEKQILLYFSDQDLQNEVLTKNWGGEMKATTGDYLAVINTNIGGQKSDRVITQTIAHTATVSADGSIIDNVKISRTHQGVKGTAFTGARNIDWLRVYAPLGSQLISSSGWQAPSSTLFMTPLPDLIQDPDLANEENQTQIDPKQNVKIYPEGDKTVFANWTQVDPGQTIIIELTYRLPFKLTDNQPNSWLERISSWFDRRNYYNYSLLVQKQAGLPAQAGAPANKFTSQLRLDRGYQVDWRYPKDLKINNGWDVSEQLTADRFYGMLLSD